MEVKQRKNWAERRKKQREGIAERKKGNKGMVCRTREEETQLRERVGQKRGREEKADEKEREKAWKREQKREKEKERDGVLRKKERNAASDTTNYMGTKGKGALF